MEDRPARPAVPSPGSRLFTSAFVALGLAELAYFTAAGIAIPLAPLFATRALGADELEVGIVVGAVALTALVLRPMAGRAADRRGRRPLLIGGALLYAVATAAHVLAPNVAGMIGLRLVLGVAEAFFFVAGIAALADLAPPGRAGEAISFNSLSLYLGIALGPLIGQALLDGAGFTAAWLGAAGLALLAAALATRVPETAEPAAPDAPLAPLVHRAAIVPGIALLCGVATMAGFFAFVALHAEAIGVADWGLVLLEFGLIVVAARVVFAKLPDRVEPYRLGAVALAMIGAGIAVVAIVPTALGLFVGTGMLALGVAFTTPAFFSAIVTRVAPHERGAAMATMTLAIDLAFGGGPILFGIAAAGGGIPAAFVAGAIVALAGAAGAAYRGARSRGPGAR